MTDLCVIGLGYIGLPTAALAASTGLSVVGVDIDPQVVAAVNAGAPHIHEPGLAELVAEQVQVGRLSATTAPVPAGIFLIAVPTPFLEDKAPDLSHVVDAAEAIAAVLRPGNLVILESTSPPRTTTAIVKPVIARLTGLEGGRDYDLAYCPERVLPGKILQELRANDRIVGAVTPQSAERAAAFYRRFVQGQILPTDAATAEVVKLVENAYRDVNIAFANEVSLIAAHLDIDPWQVIALANRHPRVNILQPGPGVGGHCIGVDPWFLVDAAPDNANLIRTARRVNEFKTQWVIDEVRRAMESLPATATIGLLGASYKPDSADLRESPALAIAKALTAAYPGRVRVSEPHREHLEGIDLRPLTDVLALDVLVVLVGHTAYRELPASVWQGKPVIDTVGVVSPPPGE
ncbi:MAG TPA: nucleotide sugar dehydrogenase [bacterium]|nr:nucleotide sugar dehydrogenase [bacterium]